MRHQTATVWPEISIGPGNLPDLPTTTIGSFPQSKEVRKNRLDHKKDRISTTWLKNRYNIKMWNNRIRKLRVKLANKFLSRGPGFPNFDFIINQAGVPWRLPGKFLNVPRRRLSWVDIVRRETVVQGQMSWQEFVKKGRLGQLRAARLEVE